MSKIHNKFESIIYDIMDLNLERQELLKNSKDCYQPIKFAQEFQTVSCNIGRQMGKTMFIAKNVGTNDVAFSYNGNVTKELETKTKFFNPYQTTIRNAKNFNDEEFRCKDDFNIIWVDEASLLTKDEILKIYETFAGKCKQFVFLG